MKIRSGSRGLRETSCLVLLVLITGVSPLRAQELDSKELISLIEDDVVKYLQTNGGLEAHSNLYEYKQRITIIECVDKTVLGYNKVGIYAFSVNTSHTKTCLLLKNDQHYEIVDPDSLITTLQMVTTLLNEGKLPDAKVIEYVEAVIRIYKINENRNPAAIESKR